MRIKEDMNEKGKHKILIIDDDHAVCTSIQLLLKRNGYDTTTANHPKEILGLLSTFKADLVLLDMNFTVETTGKQGLILLKRIRTEFPQIPVILMTGWATVQLAVEGMKLGAKDFIAKPWDNTHLLNSIQSILHIYSSTSVQKREEVAVTNEALMIGEDPSFMAVLEMAKRVAPTDASVLILGESGTGKELLAEMIHKKSQRSEAPFVKVNLGGISTSLFESEMFGHKKGAFTGAHSDREGRFSKANKGSIFLDEIGELPLESQVKLLRVLQEKQYEILGSSQTQKSDFRIISATNKNLEELVLKRRFREDLFYRVNLITLHLPPLAKRASDIPTMVKHFGSQICQLYKREMPLIRTEVLTWLSKQSFPGNIRELKNQVDRTMLLNFGKKEITIADFQETRNLSSNTKSRYNIPDVGTVSLEEMEKNMIIQALDFHEHSISKAAASLGITRSALYRRIEKHSIPHEPKI